MSGWLDGEDTEAWSATLVGRRIVSVDDREEILTLDDGTRLKLSANEGCGGCSSGWFEVESLERFDNAITAVEVLEGESEPDFYSERIEIRVYAEGTSAAAVVVTGDEGNGYYGRGFSFKVIPA